ncbi:hypothetical protein BaRGS_00030600, partial [Batillaria attramentaria]
QGEHLFMMKDSNHIRRQARLVARSSFLSDEGRPLADFVLGVVGGWRLLHRCS